MTDRADLEAFEGGRRLCVTPDLHYLAVSYVGSGGDDGAVGLYDSAGHHLWTWISPDKGRTIAEGFSADQTTIAVMVAHGFLEDAEQKLPDARLVFLSVADGHVKQEIKLTDGDLGVACDAALSKFLVKGYDPRLITREGKLLFRFTKANPPLPDKPPIDWEGAEWHLAPDGTFVLMSYRGQVYQFLADGTRQWQIDPGPALKPSETEPLTFPPQGDYVLLKGSEFTDLALFREPRKSDLTHLYIDRDEAQLGGWAVALLRVSRVESGSAGRKVEYLWGRSLLTSVPLWNSKTTEQAHSEANQARVGGPPALAEYKGGVLVVLPYQHGYDLYRIDRDGQLLGVARADYPADRVELPAGLAGDPPVLLSRCVLPDKETGLAWYDAQGHELQRWQGEGELEDIALSADGRAAVCVLGRELLIFTAQR